MALCGGKFMHEVAFLRRAPRALAKSPRLADVMVLSKPQVRREMAPIAAAGAWNMGQWGEMEEYVHAIEPRRAPTTSATAFLRAVLDVHNKEFRAARGDTMHQSTSA